MPERNADAAPVVDRAVEPSTTSPSSGGSSKARSADGDRSPGAGGRGGIRGAAHRRVALLAALTVLLLVAAVVLGVLALRERNEDTARQEALAAANRLGEGLFTISPGTLDADTDALLDASTGAFRTQFQEGVGQLRDQVAQQQASSTGRVLRSGLVSASETNAVALVVADADVRASVNGQEQQQTKHYRMQVTMDRVEDTWLVSDLTFVDPF